MSLEKRETLPHQPARRVKTHAKVVNAQKYNDELVSCVLKGIMAVKRLKRTDESQAAELFYEILSLLENERSQLELLRINLYKEYLSFWNKEYDFLGSFCHIIAPQEGSDYERLNFFECNIRTLLSKINSSFAGDEPMAELLGKLRKGYAQLMCLIDPLWTLECCKIPNVVEFIKETTEFLDELFCFAINDLSILAGLGIATECLYQGYSSLSLIKKNKTSLEV